MKRIYVDMDMVMCDFKKLHSVEVSEENEYPQSRQGFFNELEEIPNAVKSVKELMDYYDVFILTAPSYMNPHCYTDKRLWIERHFGMEFCKKLIISYDKSLLIGDYLIDDSTKNNQLLFNGQLIQFGGNEYPDWISIMKYFSVNGKEYGIKLNEELRQRFKDETEKKVFIEDLADDSGFSEEYVFWLEKNLLKLHK